MNICIIWLAFVSIFFGTNHDYQVVGEEGEWLGLEDDFKETGSRDEYFFVLAPLKILTYHKVVREPHQNS